ncbi:glycosyltransferase family 39 protein [Dysgonomonas sp. 25]|uniref:ArnT family glycosyltransferase n=1 Tax=Dysgonomonas sp. 25 TaxID=2302933 RepID=UPI0013CFB8FA|nr:glycosyltransferase family 39 protein [Dysgonomonas sp. 25]NDV70308.1 phospholipid carrier-dependent glycosyltransferase [Dysgonomonas sp. 25]
MVKTKNNPVYCIIILVVCFFAFFMNNHVIPADYMESRNLATAQEMVKNGNYLMPTMNGELRLEKPPLPTWIAAGIEHLSPDNLMLQRSMAGLAATAMIFFLFLVVARVSRSYDIGFTAALLCASFYNVVMMGRLATWDIYCHCFMLGGIYFLILALDRKGRQWGCFFLSGVLMGLSFLSKGPVSFYALLLPFLASYALVFRPRMKGKILPLAMMIAVCLLISFWWYGYIWMFHHEELLAVAGKETTAWTDRNVRPFWYYWKFPAEAGIWALFWVTSIVYFFAKRNNTDKREVFSFSIIWMFLALILLSVIPEKKTRYLFPLLIPGAINIAMYIFYSAKYAMTKGNKVIFRLNTIIVALVLCAIPVAMYIIFVQKELISLSTYIIITVSFLLLAVVMLKGLWRKRGIAVMRIFACFILAMIVAECFYAEPVRNLFINEKRHSIRLLRDNERLRDLPFYHNADEFLRMELVYESNRVITPLDLNNDSVFYGKLPLVLITQEPTDSVLKGKNIEIDYIGTFDNNWQKQRNKKYNEKLVSHVAVIRIARDSVNLSEN